jgi:GT2 family glycosyltransferase
MVTASTRYIVIVNWNGRDVTIDCLRSLAAMEGPPARTLVVDNASTDGSVEVLREMFPDIELITLGRNAGFAGGTNAGIRHALERGAELVVLLNNDTVVDPRSLSYMIDQLDADPRCGVVVPKILYTNPPELIWYAGGKISFWTGSMRHIGIREMDRGQYDIAGTTEYATGCCLLTTASVLRRVGLLDESYVMYGEDADFSWRVRRAGYTIRYEPRARVWHRLSVSAGGHLSVFKMRRKLASLVRFFSRYARWYHWMVWPWMSPLVHAWASAHYLFTRPR